MAGEGPSLTKCRPVDWRVKALHLVRGKQLAAFLALGVEELIGNPENSVVPTVILIEALLESFTTYTVKIIFLIKIYYL